MGSDVSLDFVVPRLETDKTAVSSIYKDNSKYNDIVNTTISYNSILGSKETVNIPILCINKEVYVLIDGIYNAMKELQLKPRVTGNMDKIPYYPVQSYLSDDNYKIIETDSVSIGGINGEESIVFSKILYSPDGIYVPLDELRDKCGGTFDEETGLCQIYINQYDENYKINVNTLVNKNKVINRVDDVEIYTQSIEAITFDSKEKETIGLILSEKGKIKNDGNNYYFHIDPNNNTPIKSDVKSVVLRSFANRYNKGIQKDEDKLQIIDPDGGNTIGTVAVLQCNSKKAVFFAPNYDLYNRKDVLDKLTETADNKSKEYNNFIDNLKKKFLYKYKAAKNSDGSLIVYNCFLKDAFGIAESNIYHFPGDEFISTSEAFTMLKQYYSYDGKEGVYKGITAYAIYKYKNDKGEERYSYTSRSPYTSLLNQYCLVDYVNGKAILHEDKPICYYVVTEKLDNNKVEAIRENYMYINIPLYYRTNNSDYTIFSSNPIYAGPGNWLRLYERRTVSAKGRIVKPHPDANIYDWGMKEEVSQINIWAKADMEARGMIVKEIIGSQGEITDGEGRYWIAVGPNVMNPQHTKDQSVTKEEMKYGTKIDIRVLDEKTGKHYYIPAVVGDVKEHTWPNGLYQTGKIFPTGALSVGKDDGSTVEFMCLTRDGTDNYKLVELLIYDEK